MAPRKRGPTFTPSGILALALAAMILVAVVVVAVSMADIAVP